MHRRQLLTGLSAAAGVSLLGTACGGAGGAPSRDDEVTLSVLQASLEYLPGTDRWVSFGLLDQDNSPIEGAEVEVYLRSLPDSADEESEIVAGPIDATYSPAAETGQGVYYLNTEIPEEGFYDLVVVAGDDHGFASIQVVDPANSQVPVPGGEAVSAPTATVGDDRGQFALCTQDPPCGMHEMSLDEALESGRPLVLMFATPQFCQTAVCGPSVATLDQIRADGDWGDTIFIHSEIFAEEPVGEAAATAALVDAVAAWGLPSEPWLFTIGGDGVIVDRLDGPMPEPVVRDYVEDLTA